MKKMYASKSVLKKKFKKINIFWIFLYIFLDFSNVIK